MIVTKDAKALARRALADDASTVKYEAEKPAALLEEDRAIGATRLGIRREAVRVTPASEVFAEEAVSNPGACCHGPGFLHDLCVTSATRRASRRRRAAR